MYPILQVSRNGSSLFVSLSIESGLKIVAVNQAHSYRIQLNKPNSEAIKMAINSVHIMRLIFDFQQIKVSVNQSEVAGLFSICRVNEKFYNLSFWPDGCLMVSVDLRESEVNSLYAIVAGILSD